MARKPKAARNDAPASPGEEDSPNAIEAPAPSRRGRKPKAAAPAEPLATMDSDDATAGSFDADGSVADPAPAPARKRPGPKPRATAASPLDGAKPKRGRPARTPDAALEPAQAEAEAPAAEAPPPPEDPAPAAAQWDRATDTVRFDWAAIEQTASREGPNQGMAKLLVAARAEGANSRWPL